MSEALSLDRQIACVRREIAMRKRVYPRFIFSAKMTPTQAEAEIAAMEAVLTTLEAEHKRVTPELLE